jgi:hypothetical protein
MKFNVLQLVNPSGALLAFTLSLQPACSSPRANEAAPAQQAPAEPPAVAPGTPAAPLPNSGVDGDGVVKLYPDAPGSAFLLADGDLNAVDGLEIEEGTLAIAGEDGAVRFWTVPTYEFEYTEGEEAGKTARLHVSAPGARQQFDWETQTGVLAGPDDLGDQEFTAYVRVHGIFDPEHAAFELKIRGGSHTEDEPALASCSLMTFASSAAPGVSRFGKELNHPEYDFVSLPLRFSTELTEGRWYGLKLVSVVEPARPDRVLNRLYVDDEPFLADGSPRNGFRLLSEYADRAGVSTGFYDTVVDWRGVVTTLRIDGVDALDVARLGVRAIAPLQSPSGTNASTAGTP